jgi:hypothetical protein
MNVLPRPIRLGLLSLMVSLPMAVLAAGISVNVKDTEPLVKVYKPQNYINPNNYGSHYVSVPTSTTPTVLVVFMGGTGSTPSEYTTIVDEATNATGGYPTNYASIGLAYINGNLTQTIGQACTDASSTSTDKKAVLNDCFTQMRGESAFGSGIVYPGLSGPPYDASIYTANNNYPSTSLGDSIVNRLVFLIDYMACTDSKHAAFWKTFLIDNTTSPYVTPHTADCSKTNYSRHVVPNWPQIVLAGHSQGGGTAAFMGMTLPGGVRRVAMFSAPQDNLDGNVDLGSYDPGQVAQWILGPTQTPLNNFYALRNASSTSSQVPTPNNSAEGSLGNNVFNNLAFIGQGTTVGGLGNTPTSVVDGSRPPTSKDVRNLYLTSPAYTSTLSNHNSSALTSAALLPNEATIWDWIFSAGGSDPN